MTIDTIITQYDFNLAYARTLVNDLTEAQMTLVPADGLNNHPAFTLGHLISGSADLARDLGAEFEMPEHWEELFVRMGPGDPRLPDPDEGQYPTKEALLDELGHQHEKVKGLLNAIKEDQFSASLPWRFSNVMPTLGDVVCFMCINHEAMHLGQLAAWRRAVGLPSALAAMPHNTRPYT